MDLTKLFAENWTINEDFSFSTFDRLGFRVRSVEIKIVHPMPNLSTYLKLSYKIGLNKAERLSKK